VATYATCGVIFNHHFTANLPKNLLVKKPCKSVTISQDYGYEFVASLFWPTPYINSYSLNVIVKYDGRLYGPPCLNAHYI